jgi:hypothetical protein
MLLIGIAASSLALISVMMNKERSLLVFLAILVGLYSIFGFAGSAVNVFLN